MLKHFEQHSLRCMSLSLQSLCRPLARNFGVRVSVVELPRVLISAICFPTANLRCAHTRAGGTANQRRSLWVYFANAPITGKAALRRCLARQKNSAPATFDSTTTEPTFRVNMYGLVTLMIGNTDNTT